MLRFKRKGKRAPWTDETVSLGGPRRTDGNEYFVPLSFDGDEAFRAPELRESETLEPPYCADLFNGDVELEYHSPEIVMENVNGLFSHALWAMRREMRPGIEFDDFSWWGQLGTLVFSTMIVTAEDFATSPDRLTVLTHMGMDPRPAWVFEPPTTPMVTFPAGVVPA